MILSAIKSNLEAYRISHKQIADQMCISKSAVTDILNDKYKGAEETKARVLKQCELLLMEKRNPPDLNPLIYSKVGSFIKMLEAAIRSPKFSDEDAMFFFELKIDLKKFKARMKQDGADQETEAS